MAKASFTKLKLKTDTSVKTINFNDIEIEIKQYLSINETISLIENIINNSATELKFYSPALVHLFYALEVIYNYTNISFTDKQKEEPAKLYDTIVSSGLWNAIEEAIPEDELDFICEALGCPTLFLKNEDFSELILNVTNRAKFVQEFGEGITVGVLGEKTPEGYVDKSFKVDITLEEPKGDLCYYEQL